MRARDKQFEPLDNAEVTLKVKTPDKREIELVAESSDEGRGHVPGDVRSPRGRRVSGTVSVTAADGSEVGERETGWAVEPETEEFRTLAVNRPLLDAASPARPAAKCSTWTAWNRSSASLPNRKIPVDRKLDVSAVAPVARVSRRPRLPRRRMGPAAVEGAAMKRVHYRALRCSVSACVACSPRAAELAPDGARRRRRRRREGIRRAVPPVGRPLGGAAKQAQADFSAIGLAEAGEKPDRELLQERLANAGRAIGRSRCGWS